MKKIAKKMRKEWKKQYMKLGQKYLKLFNLNFAFFKFFAKRPLS